MCSIYSTTKLYRYYALLYYATTYILYDTQYQ